jgi:Ca2+-binding EF-hand superfamily protein
LANSTGVARPQPKTFMRTSATALLVLLSAAPTCRAQQVELRPVTPEIYKDSATAAQRLMDKLDVNLDGVADMNDAEQIVARGIGSAEQLAIQGAMRADMDSDGRITQEEVTAFARRNFDLLQVDGTIPGRGGDFEGYLGHQMDEFRNWDLNHDGVVTRREVESFLTSENPRQSASVRREYEFYLKTMDTNKDGKITIAEMTRAFTRASTYPIFKPAPAEPSRGVGLKIGQFVSMQATAILREFDAGPDEIVTYAQAVKKGGENCYLLSMDQERDGHITRAKIERRAAAAAAVADVDKDGYLSQSEMIDAWTMLHGMKTWKLPEPVKASGQ